MVQEGNGSMQTLHSIDIQCDHVFTANKKTDNSTSMIVGHIGSLSSIKLLNLGYLFTCKFHTTFALIWRFFSWWCRNCRWYSTRTVSQGRRWLWEGAGKQLRSETQGMLLSLSGSSESSDIGPKFKSIRGIEIEIWHFFLFDWLDLSISKKVNE